MVEYTIQELRSLIPSGVTKVTSLSSEGEGVIVSGTIVNIYNVKVSDGSLFQLFSNKKNLKSADLSGLYSSNITNIAELFVRCTRLTDIKLPSFNSSNITTANGAFYYCPSLSSLDLSEFNISEVSNISGMFGRCYSLTYLNLSNFDTSKVTDASDLFTGMNAKIVIDENKWTLSKERTAYGAKNLIFAKQGIINLNINNYNIPSYDYVEGIIEEFEEKMSKMVSAPNYKSVLTPLEEGSRLYTTSTEIFTAPKTCWLKIRLKNLTENGREAVVYINSVEVLKNETQNYQTFIIPLAKGDVVEVLGMSSQQMYYEYIFYDTV